jgi:hypothetical protein
MKRHSSHEKVKPVTFSIKKIGIQYFPIFKYFYRLFSAVQTLVKEYKQQYCHCFRSKYYTFLKRMVYR